MTLRGAEKLREELDFLKSVRRPEIIAAIAEAREHGDLKENAEYHAAREQQGFCEGRIKDIEAKLSNAQVIDVTKMPNNGRVIFGASVFRRTHTAGCCRPSPWRPEKDTDMHCPWAKKGDSFSPV